VLLVGASQVVFLSLLLVATAIDPSVATHRDEGGISNFGVHLATGVPFTVGFLGAAALLWAGAGALREAAGTRGLRVGLHWLAVALVAVLATTYGYRHGPVPHGLHVVVATAATAYETGLGVWLAAVVVRDAIGIAACAVQLAGAALALGALLGLEHLLYVAQLVSSAAFAVLLVHATARVASRRAG
jgi:hypothetical protein